MPCRRSETNIQKPKGLVNLFNSFRIIGVISPAVGVRRDAIFEPLLEVLIHLLNFILAVTSHPGVVHDKLLSELLVAVFGKGVAALVCGDLLLLILRLGGIDSVFGCVLFPDDLVRIQTDT